MNEEQLLTLTKHLEKSNKKVFEEANAKQTETIKQYIQKEIAVIKDEVQQKIAASENQFKVQYEDLNQKYNRLQKQLKKNNIVIFGLTPPEQDLSQFVIKEISTLLEVSLTSSDIDNVFAFGKARHILVKLTTFLKKKEILSHCKKLKGTGVSISEDLSKEEREENKILRKHLKEAKEKDLNAYIKNNQLVVNGQTYTAEELQKEEEEIEIQNLNRPNSAPPTPNAGPRQFYIEDGDSVDESESTAKINNEIPEKLEDRVFVEEGKEDKENSSRRICKEDKKKIQEKEKKEPAVRKSSRTEALRTLNFGQKTPPATNNNTTNTRR